MPGAAKPGEPESVPGDRGLDLRGSAQGFAEEHSGGLRPDQADAGEPAARLVFHRVATNVGKLLYPNESRKYRAARDALRKDERELHKKVKSVAAKRRKLPLGGQLKEDYV